MQQKIKKVFHFTGSRFFRRITALVFSHFPYPSDGCFLYLKHNIKQASGHLLSTLEKCGDFFELMRRENGIPRGVAGRAVRFGSGRRVAVGVVHKFLIPAVACKAVGAALLKRILRVLRVLRIL